MPQQGHRKHGALRIPDTLGISRCEQDLWTLVAPELPVASRPMREIETKLGASFIDCEKVKRTNDPLPDLNCWKTEEGHQGRPRLAE